MYAAGTDRPVKCAKGAALYIQIFVEILFSQMAFAKDVGKRTNEKNVLHIVSIMGNDGDYVGT